MGWRVGGLRLMGLSLILEGLGFFWFYFFEASLFVIDWILVGVGHVSLVVSLLVVCLLLFFYLCFNSLYGMYQV